MDIQKRGENMNPKRGRHPIDNPKAIQYRIRLTQEEAEKLEYCCEATGRTKADILREGLERVYQEVKK
jgi:predicted DNA-binding protein